MRRPTEDELKLIQSDIRDFEKYCLGKSLITDTFKQRFDGVKIKIGEVEGIEGAAGKANRTDKTVSIRPDKMQEDK